MAKTLSLTGIQTGDAIEAKHVSQSIKALTGEEAYDITISGSLTVQGPINGTSGILNNLSSSYALTASHALNSSGGSSGVGTLQQVMESGSVTTLVITASAGISSSGAIISPSFTGSLSGSALESISASFSQTASYVATAQTASYVATAQTASYVLNAVSASFAQTASFIDDSAKFPFSGSAIITGSLIISSSNQEQSLQLYGSGSTIFSIEGSRGTLFSIDDDESDGKLFSVNNVSGTPVLEVYEDNTVKLGKQNGFGIVISGSNPLPNNSDAKILITGSIYHSGSNAYFNAPLTASSFRATPGVINQLTASYAISASVEITKEISSSHADRADTASYVETAQTASFVTTAQTASYVLASNIDQPFTDITASGNISASGTGSFSDGRFVGKVGIGTSNPATELEARGTSRFSADGFGRVEIIPTTGNGNTAVIKQSTGSPRNGGNLKIQVNHLNNVGGNLFFATNGDNTRMTISSSGDVGIGTTTPGEKLEVIGNISASGNLFANVTDSSNTGFKTVMYDPTTGQFFRTGSYGGGGGGAGFPFSGSAIITGSLLVSGSNVDFTNSTGVSGSFSGSFEGEGSGIIGIISSSYASTASYVTTAQTASYVENAQTASYVTLAQTASFVTTAQTASYVLNAISSSYALSASYAVSASHEIIKEISSSHADFADTASYVENAQTASFVTLAQTASYVTTAQTSSYILASNIDQPFTDITASGNISASGYISASNLDISASATIDGPLTLTQNNTNNPLTINNGTGTEIYFPGTLETNITSQGVFLFKTENSQGYAFGVNNTLNKAVIGDPALATSATTVIADTYNGRLILRGNATPNEITGSLSMTGSAGVEAFISASSFNATPGTINELTASYAMTASTAESILPAINFKPVVTHTSNFTSTSSYAGHYNIVGGTLAITVTTGSTPTDLTPGMEWDFFQTSSGDSFTFTAGTGVEIISRNSNKRLAAVGSAGTLKYISGQTFHLVGDLTI